MTLYTKTMMESLAEVRNLNDAFKSHMMYDPKTGKGYKANTMRDHLKMKDMGYTHDAPKKEEVELDEAPRYELYHKDFSTAMQHAYMMAKKLHGITIDPKEIDDKVATGPRKPSEGKTNKYRLKGDKGAIQVQVYNRGGSKPYELNFYKEDVELDESVIDQVKEIASKKAAAKIGGVMVDSFTASAISQIYDKVNDANKKKMEKLSITKLAKLAFKMMQKMQKNDYVPEEADLDEALSSKDQKAIEDYVSKFMSKMTPDLKAKMAKDPKAAAAVLAKMAMNTEEVDEAYELGTDEYRKYTQEVTPGEPGGQKEVEEASARADAMKAMRKDKKVDPADVDTDATDDDIKGASKNIIMQMRKAVSMRGNFKVEFGDKKKVKIPVKIAQAVQNKYNSMKKPADKEKFQSQVAKSYKDMLRVLKAGYMMKAAYEEVELDENFKKMSDDKLKSWISKNDTEDSVSPVFGKQIKSAYLELKSRGLSMKEETILDRIEKKLKERKNG
jgi:hypothetical protein